MSPYQQHVKAWESCTRCDLSKVRRKVIFSRGVLPADVLFIGEAPGESEDVVGLPFVGPAGKLLDRMIEEAGGDSIRKAWTNLIGCIPKHEEAEEGVRKTEPLPGEISSCSLKLHQFLQLCKPKLIVAVGELSEKYAKKQSWKEKTGAKIIAVTHPAAILRAGPERQGMMVKRCIVQLMDGFRELTENA